VTALDSPGLRRVIWVLSTTVITSYGVLYYAFAVLSSSIVDDTGWSAVELTAAFSAGQIVSGVVGVVLGRRLDLYGPRIIMTAGSAMSVLGMLMISAAQTYAWFFGAWIITGIGMAGVLYPPAFAALTHWGGSRRVAALTTLTLVAGLASTMFAPLTAGLEAATDWRTTYVILALVLGVVTIPLHWRGLDLPWAPAATASDGGGEPGSDARTRPFLILLFTSTMAAFVVYAVVINLVPLLIERGLSTTEAAIGLGIGGLGQVAGRLGYARLAANTSAVSRAAIVIAAVSATTAMLAVTPAKAWNLFVVSVLVGVSRGLFTLVQATAISDRWGTSRYGHLSGILSAPMLLAAAIAPFAGAVLATWTGGQRNAFLVMSAIALLATVSAFGTSTRLVAAPRVHLPTDSREP
jgi:MFS family permease